MSLETRREKFLYHGLIPIVAAISGAIAATWFQSTTIDKAQISDIVSLLKDPALNAQQKLQALETYREITDRPWAVIRSLVTYLGFAVASIVGALSVGGYFRRDS